MNPETNLNPTPDLNSDTIFLEHILRQITFILTRTKTISYGDFLEDEVLKMAVERAFEIIGEAANHISSGFQHEHPEISWKGMTGLRNRLIHQYFKINYAQVWEIIEEDIPVLHEQIKDLLEK